MKIAVATDDGETVSQHFGRAPYYVVLTVENGKVIGRERLDKPAHHHGHGEHQRQGEQGGAHEGHSHDDMLAPIKGCEVLLATGMGYPAYQSLQDAGIRPIITDVREIDEAVRQCLSGGLLDELHLDLVPVLLGNGIPLFGPLAAGPMELENVVIVQGAGVTHLAYRMVKQATPVGQEKDRQSRSQR